MCYGETIEILILKMGGSGTDEAIPYIPLNLNRCTKFLLKNEIKCLL